MRILVALTYYRPHISGLTIYAERLARAWARQGHAVTVLTSQYDRALPEREHEQGVDIVRAPVAARLSKGVLMPTIGWLATQLVPRHDVLCLHLPQFDAAGLAVRGRLFKKPIVLVYHSDLVLPPSLLNLAAGTAIQLANHASARLADRIITHNADLAQHSPFLSQYLAKMSYILAPVEMAAPTPEAVQAFRVRHGLEGRGPIIGLAARLAAEKGVEYLFEALPDLQARYPNVLIAHTGPREAIGEDAYRARLQPLIDRHRAAYLPLGTLPAADMPAFFASCDVMALPSWNNTETFGLVQVEAALCGTPCVASDIPGVRVAHTLTGMGRTAPPRDPRGLAAALLDVLDHRERFVRPRAPIATLFSPDTVAAEHLALFERLRQTPA